jgi:hypothetical protein
MIKSKTPSQHPSLGGTTRASAVARRRRAPRDRVYRQVRENLEICVDNILTFDT